MISLAVEKRNAKKALATLRKGGFLPAVYYGKKETATPITVSLKDFTKVWKEAGESAVITMQMKGGEALEALIQDVDLDPITSVPRHADFYVFEKGKKLKIKVPLEFVGVSPAVKDLGGVLVKVLREISIEALPKDLPHSIAVDIAPLVAFGNVIAAKDVALPAGVTLVERPDDVVVSVYEPKEEVEKEEAPVDLSTIEVEKKGKEAKEGEVPAEPGAPAAPKAAKEAKGEK